MSVDDRDWTDTRNGYLGYLTPAVYPSDFVIVKRDGRGGRQRFERFSLPDMQ